MKARTKFTLMQNGPDYFDYSADIAIGPDKFLVGTASMPASGADGKPYLSLTFDDLGNTVDLGEVEISDDMFCEITGYKTKVSGG